MMKYNRVIHILSNVQRIHLPIKSMASFMLGEIIIPVASLTSWLTVVLGVLAPKVFEHKIRVYIIAAIFFVMLISAALSPIFWKYRYEWGMKNAGLPQKGKAYVIGHILCFLGFIITLSAFITFLCITGVI